MSTDTTYEAWHETLSRKSVAAGAIVLNERGQLLLVRTVYNGGWKIPGGIAEQGESPMRACAREIREELGLTLEIGRLLCVDHKGSPADSMQYVFNGGVLSDAATRGIVLQTSELSECRFVADTEVPALALKSLAKGIPWALKGLRLNQCFYLEDGESPLERFS